MQLRKLASFVLVTVAAVAVCQSASAGFNIILNGGFEAPVVGGTYTTLTNGLTNWTIDSGSVDLIHTYWQPYEPTQSLDLNGDGPGTISQSFATVPATTYLLSFAYSNNPDLYNTSPTPQAEVTVVGSSTLLSDTISYRNATSRSVMNWVTYSGTFIADSTSTTLKFAAQNTGGFGIALDAVSVSAVPEASTFVSWGIISMLGLALVGKYGSKLQLAA